MMLLGIALRDSGVHAMVDIAVLNGKRILAVDDEPDVLDVIAEGLPQCKITTADTYESAKESIRLGEFDLALLDIMGVKGFELLAECRTRRLPAAMLTAHAIDLNSINKSVRLGAVSFLPKDELARLPELLAEIFESLEQEHAHWPKLFTRLGPFFKERLGIVWEDIEKPPHPPYYY